MLVTGHTGFIGSNLVPYLQALGLEVIGCSRRTGCDASDMAALSKFLDGCDMLFHLAADARPAESLMTPEETIHTNVQMTIKVALACRDAGLPLIFVSSCEIYGDSDHVIDENSPLRPTNPYAASKAASDRILYSFYKCYGLDVKIVRLFNPYGPNQQLNKVIPTFYRQAKANKSITVYGNGTDCRDYVYVEDVVRGLWDARKLPSGEAVNLATGIGTTNIELAKLVIEKTSSTSKIEFVPYPKLFGGIHRQIGSYEKARKLLGWEPKVPLAEGIDRTLRWLESLRG